MFGTTYGSIGFYIPEDYGIFISADFPMLNLSPQLYEEFALPYLNRISEKYGGIFLHSCGNFEHLVNSLKLIKNLRGINFGASETSYKLIVENFAGKVIIGPTLGLNSRIRFKSLEDYTKEIMQYRKMNTGNYFQISEWRRYY